MVELIGQRVVLEKSDAVDVGNGELATLLLIDMVDDVTLCDGDGRSQSSSPRLLAQCETSNASNDLLALAFLHITRITPLVPKHRHRPARPVHTPAQNSLNAPP